MTTIVNNESTQCAVFDQTPGSQQKKINIVVRPHFTVGRVIFDIQTQYAYTGFDLLLQPYGNKDLVYLNDLDLSLLYEVPGFESSNKNYLIILPAGTWDGNVKRRYNLPMKPITTNVTTFANNYQHLESDDTLNICTNINSNRNSQNNNIDSGNNKNKNNNNNNSIYMEIENTLSESTKAAITKQLTQILPNNHDSVTDSFNFSPLSDPEQLSDDDLALGASASPTEQLKQFDMHDEENSSDIFYHRSRSHPLGNLFKSGITTATSAATSTAATDRTTGAPTKGYVGLVNQAMTCYLNSLLQALYMTPEFRNALYRWEFDLDNEAKNIPYQLQKLFLNLQTSPKSSVETTDLTRSFGWDSTEAWQQHDVQELCRVMFDALEQKSKNTKQQHFISKLYEGKMLDYVKCLECNTEKTREDTFLDIPLPVRPFGSTVAYSSIEEAIRAFVQPETLDGNNQYFCDMCSKKCDAHKGLKFKTFPYVLTLHLKRFDFDYQTMHRIKLNDRVTFPQSLNLNSFINSCDSGTLHNLHAQSTTIDDCSIADSGSAMEEDNLSSGVVTTASSSQHENDINDDDEGIDMSSSTDQPNNKSVNVERLKQESGPYLYELFAIMIHSGSASGGHYYAYIKDFENNEWFCFNDQTVSPITQEDVQKSFGGNASGAYYSSVYSSSTNAYMLMYRQVDSKRNESAMKETDLPEHIKKLLPLLNAEDEMKNSRIGRHPAATDLVLPDLHKPRVYFYNPAMKKLKMTRVYVSQNFDINHVLSSAYEMLDVENFAPLSRCRLVAYDSTSEKIIESFDDLIDPSLKSLRSVQTFQLDFLLEYRAVNQKFEKYERIGTTWHVYMVDLNTMEMDGPFLVHSPAHEQNSVLRHSIAVRLHIEEDKFLLATLKNLSKKAFVAYDLQPTAEAQEQLQTIVNTKLRYITYFYLNVPNTEASNLDILDIPAYESQNTTPTIELPLMEQRIGIGMEISRPKMINSVLQPKAKSCGENTELIEAMLFSNSIIGDSIDVPAGYQGESPLPPNITPGHESNSEDSSLSDGDRTLVESIQNRGGGDSQISSTSHSPQLSSPEDEAASHDSLMRVQALYNGYSNTLDAAASTAAITIGTHFFYANKLECIDAATNQMSSLSDEESASRKPIQAYKILVSTNMRMDTFKRHIENIIKVPANYFKLQRKNENTISNNSTNTLAFVNEGETISVELGKILEPDEFKAKIYFMRLADLDNDTGKLPCVCEWIYNTTTTAAVAKKELVAKLKRIDSSYQTLTVKNCRMWVKGGRNPIKILKNEECLHNELKSTIVSEFLIQECEDDVDPQPSDESQTLFVRRWHPDKLQFDKFQEITLDSNSEIRNVIARITDIPEEDIAYTKANGTFPCTNISLLSVNSSMSWFSIPATIDKYPLTMAVSGSVYFYKDVKATFKELTSEERGILSAREKTRLDRLLSISSASNYSPRRERGLKIHLDSPQKPTERTNSSEIRPLSGSLSARKK